MADARAENRTFDSRIVEILEIAPQLAPRAFHDRIAYWRRGGLPNGMSESISRSRSQPMPAFDDTDRELQQANREYRDDVDDAVRLLRHALALQVKYLFPIVIAPEEQREMATDAESCMCSNTKELWERENRTRWRLKRGLGPCCYSSWAADGKPDILGWLRTNRPTEEQATA